MCQKCREARREWTRIEELAWEEYENAPPPIMPNWLEYEKKIKDAKRAYSKALRECTTDEGLI